MSHRLQVLIPEQLNAKIARAAQRSRTSKGAWVWKAIEDALVRPPSKEPGATDPLAGLASLNGPTADIDEMIAQIESGRS
jgi:hypothetical protein